MPKWVNWREEGTGLCSESDQRNLIWQSILVKVWIRLLVLLDFPELGRREFDFLYSEKRPLEWIARIWWGVCEKNNVEDSFFQSWYLFWLIVVNSKYTSKEKEFLVLEQGARDLRTQLSWASSGFQSFYERERERENTSVEVPVEPLEFVLHNALYRDEGVIKQEYFFPGCFVCCECGQRNIL
ncbi:hypothetical protein B0H34DRAFT_676125 [Crassisporium funariophilum]|nr:hypothetical protein B0H34DRAFT_676125 [Crassisporium funariophilum]